MAAAGAVAACALVAIAWMMGWVGGANGSPPTPASLASPGQQVTGTAPGVALPGEPLVTDEPPKPATPSNAKPAQPAGQRASAPTAERSRNAPPQGR